MSELVGQWIGVLVRVRVRRWSCVPVGDQVSALKTERVCMRVFFNISNSTCLYQSSLDLGAAISNNGY